MPVEELARRVDEAAAAVAALDAPAREAAQELRSAVEAAHRAALLALVRGLREDERSRAVLLGLLDEPVVSLVLSVHGLVRAAPAPAPPPASAHPSTPSPSPSPRSVAASAGPPARGSRVLVPLAQLRVRPPTPSAPAAPAAPAAPGAPAGPEGPGWAEVPGVTALAEGEVLSARLDGGGGEVGVVVVRSAARLSAFRDACAHLGLRLGGAVVDAAAGTLVCPWHGWCYDAVSGECLSSPGARLERLPMSVRGGRAWVRVTT